MEKNNSIKINSEIPSIESYNNLLKNSQFLEMEKFSNLFIDSNKEILLEYGKKWVSDPLHSWSRQWEYPYVYQRIHNYLNNKKGMDKLKVLDAGSGVTFFPYYINSTFERAQVDCCDVDESYSPMFSKMNIKFERSVNFHNSDLKNLKFKDNSYDIIYCISVLEHTNDYETILKEFSRVLKNDGLLILTFDISIDGFFDVSIDEAKKLINLVEKYFKNIESRNSHSSLDELSNSNKFMTTDYIKKIDKSLLPWKHSILSSIIRKVRSRNPNLTIYCQDYVNVIE